MIEIRKYIPCSDQGTWDAFVESSKQGTFLQKRTYMDYHSDRFTDHSLMIYRRDKLYALLPAHELGTTFCSHLGLTYAGLITTKRATANDVCQTFAAINNYLRQRGFKKVIYKPTPRIYHLMPADEDLYALFKECHAQLKARNLSSTITLRQPMKWYNIRKSGAKKASSQNIRIVYSDDNKSYDEFWKILTDNLRKKYHAKPVHTAEEIKMLHARFPENIKLYVALQEDGKILGGTLLYISHQVVHTQYISASEEGKEKHALDALFKYLIQQEYKDYEYFDFGTSNEDDGKFLNTSLIYQKEGFGGRGVIYDTYEWEL